MRAEAPFAFFLASHLVRLLPLRAHNLGEMLACLQCCPEESLFQHTFRTRGEHHFLNGGLSNDFAQWAFAACNEPPLAEALGAVDLRDFTALSDLRSHLVGLLDRHLAVHPYLRDRGGSEPFHFCAAETIVLPTHIRAHTLPEFMHALAGVGVHVLHHHFIDARLRLRLDSNDFSEWLERELHLPEAAERFRAIDVHRANMENVRRKMLSILADVL